jgi:response regulator RpfG family c-di-GMP phosphodiesterase
MPTATFEKKLNHIVTTFKILVAAHRWTAERVVQALAPFGYLLDVQTDGHSAQKALLESPPHLVISSVDLPHPDGFTLLRLLRSNPKIADTPFMMIVSGASPDEEIRAFQLGADEVVSESTSDIAFRARVRVLLRLSTYRTRLQNEKRMLGILVAERTRELTEITLAMVTALEKATELSDVETGGHILRVSSYSGLISEELGLSSEFCEKLRLYAPLHDVGKVGVPDHILKKKGKLTPQEYEEMKKHTLYGYELLQTAKADRVACNIALSHHERWDGSGYPEGLKGKSIPIEARIVSVADVFDALATDRHYKPALHPKEALNMLLGELRHLFDPMVLDAVQRRKEDLLAIHSKETRTFR